MYKYMYIHMAPGAGGAGQRRQGRVASADVRAKDYTPEQIQ